MKSFEAYSVYLVYSGAMMFLRYMHFTAAAVYYITVVGLNPFELVLVGTTLMVVILLAEVPTGVLADTYSRRLSVIVGTALIGAGFLIEGLIPAFGAVLLTQLIWGIGVTFTSGALEAWIADELGGKDLDAVYLRGSQVGHAGALAGIAASIALAGVQLSAPLVAAGLTGLALATLLLVVMPEHGFAPRGGEHAGQAALATLRAGTQLVRRSQVLPLIMGITLFFGMASESFDRLWEIHFLRNTTLPGGGQVSPVTWFGMINAGALLLSIAAAGLVRRRVNTRSNWGLTRILTAMTALLLAGMVGFGLAQSFGVALAAYWAAYLMRRIYEPLYMAWLSQHSESSVRATVLSSAGQVDAVGQIAGGPLFGLIATSFSTGAAIVAAALTLLPTFWLYRLVLRRDAAAPDAEAPTVAAPAD